MSNPNWYLVCDINTKKATDLIQIPATWGAVTGLGSQSDVDLENFYQWSPYPNISFVTVSRAQALLIDAASITQILSITKPAVLAWLRSMRDPLLAASDAVTLSDRWMSLDVVAQNNVTTYRQQLRDLTNQSDLFAITWPAIPTELDTIRTIDTSSIVSPHPDFLKSLSDPFPPLDLPTRQNNQWLRIKAKRDKHKSSGVKVTVTSLNKDFWFWTDDPTRNQYSLLDGRAIRNSLTDDIVLDNWKTMSGEFISMTVGLLRQVIDAGIDNEKLIFNNAESHYQAMLLASDPDSYDYSTGWPQTYDDFIKQ